MKKFHLIRHMFPCMIIAALCSCSDYFDEAEANMEYVDYPCFLDISYNHHSTVPSTGTIIENFLSISNEMEYQNSSTQWKITDLPDWIEVLHSTTGAPLEPNVWQRQYGESRWNLSVGANPSPSTRIGIFKVVPNIPETSWACPVSVTQSGRDGYFKYEMASSISANAQTVTVKIDTNYPKLDFEQSISYNDPFLSDFKYDESSGVLTFNITKHVGDYSRDFKILARAYTLDQETGEYKYRSVYYIYGTQLSAKFSATSGRIEANPRGESFTVSLTSDVPWTAKCDVSWLSFSPKSGNPGTTKINIECTENFSSDSRGAYIYFYLNGSSTTKNNIYVYQKGRYIEAGDSWGDNSISLSFDGVAKKNQTIKSNIDWEVLDKPEWLTVSPMSGSDNGTLSLSATVNNSSSSRSGKVTVGIKDTNIQTTFTAKQDEKKLDVGENSIWFPWKEGSKIISIKSVGEWNASISEGWISLSQYYGNGDADVTLSVTPNYGNAYRNGTVTIDTGTEKKTITIVQDVQYFKVENTGTSFDCNGGDISLDITTSVGLEFSVKYLDEQFKDWIKLESETQNSSGSIKTLKFSIAANPSTCKRNAQVEIMPTEEGTLEDFAQGLAVAISQTGRGIRLSNSQITFVVAGGTSPTIRIEADGQYDVRKGTDDGWYTLVFNKNSNSFYVVASENNTGAEREGLIIIELLDLPDGEKYEAKFVVAQRVSNTNAKKPGKKISIKL